MKKNSKLVLIILIVIVSISLVLSVVNVINLIINSADVFFGNISIFAVIVLMLALYVLLTILRRQQVKEIKHQLYHSEKNGKLENVLKFVDDIEYYDYKKKKNKKGFIVSFCAGEYQELSLTVLTEEEKNDLINSVSDYLVEKYFDKDDTHACYDGDGEFYLYYETTSQEQLIKDVQNIRAELNVLVKQKTYAPSVQIYFGFCEVKTDEYEECIKNANIARFYNENTSETIVLKYEPFMRRENRDSMRMKGDIERALKNGEFEVYYQPKFNIKANRFVGAEALVRWNHPEKGLLAPGAFIPFAEQTGQIVEIDRFVFEQVMKDINSWKKNKTRLLLISINLSKNELFKNDTIDFYKNMISKYEVSPLLIEIEITESAVSKDVLYAANILSQLKQLRFKTSMDDFGTGYSSLSYLKKLPVDVLKLDKSFFDEIEIDKKARDIVSITIQLAKALDMNVIAEGIETEKQVNILKTTQCDCIQGYYYSSALSKNEYEAFLRKNDFE